MDEPADPFEELAASACNLLADIGGVRYCGVVALDGGALHGASSEFLSLPAGRQRRLLTGVVAAGVAAGVAPSSQPVLVAAGPEAGGAASVLVFPETGVAVFHVARGDRAVDQETFRRAAAAVLQVIRRIDGLRAERAELTQATRLLAHVEELANVGGWEQTLATGRLIWSDAIYAMHGLERAGELTLQRVLALYPSPARERLTLELERAAADGGGFDITSPIRTPSGDQRIVRTVARSAADRDGGRKLYGITQDVTSQLSAERRMWWAANHDPVTSLPNRLLFEDRIATAVQRARRDDRMFALVIVAIADHARLADKSGYTVPDKHMLDVAARLGAVTRESDTVARVSLSEFALILNDVKDRAGLAPPMARLSGQILDMQRQEPGAGIGMSVGVAFYPAHASGPDDLTRAAEMALAKASGRLDEPIVVFDRQIANDVARRRETILVRARDSLAKREFLPYYQPQIDMETGEVVGVEALVRWQTPDLLLDAKDFTYVLEDHEVGGQVGRAVLDGVIADVARLRRITDRSFRVSVNASRTEVLRNDFLDTFLEKTRSGNLKPNDFTIEITEDVIIGVDDRALHDKVSFLASSGVAFSLDDFGTGYASLIHITSFPIKEIKIDKQFVHGIQTDRRKRAIVKGIIQIARSMGLHVIAEGVETLEQQEVLRDVGCRTVQGYLYAVPLPFDEFVELVVRGS